MKTSIEALFILLVEPSSTQRRVIAGYFEHLGVLAHEGVDCGRAALEAAARNAPDLVISAMYLPDMTGAELLVALRDGGGAETGFMLVSSETAFDIIDPVRQAGASAVLPKPFTADQLRHALQICLDFQQPERLSLRDVDAEELKVLVVDDSSFARRAIRRTLSRMGIEHFVEAADGAEAMALIDSHFFDLVLTDYNMPRVDGRALLEYIRSKSNQRSVPVLMVTTEGDVDKLAAVEQAGVSAICDKPFEPALVKRLIERSLATAGG